MREVIARHIREPFEWGVSDCTFAFDAIEAMTGFDAIADCRGYLTERGAIIALKRTGFASVRDLVASCFEEIHPGLAIRGDIGYPEEINPLMSPAIIDGSQVFSKQPRGPVILERSAIARAWAV